MEWSDPHFLTGRRATLISAICSLPFLFLVPLPPVSLSLIAKVGL